MIFRSEDIEMTNERLLKVHEIVTDLWKNYRANYETMSNTDAWWDSLIDSQQEIAKKYNDDQLVIDLAIALFNDLERICKAS